jgi:hypothetical protein
VPSLWPLQSPIVGSCWVRLGVSDVLERSKVGGGVVWPDSKEDEVAWVSWLWEARLSSTLEPE